MLAFFLSVMRIRNAKDFWAGIMFAALGAFFIVFAQENDMGSAAHMGPAFFPTLLGALLAVIGLYIAVLGPLFQPTLSDGRVEPFHWDILSWILGSVFVFTLLLKPLGLMVSLAVMIVLSLLAERKLHLKETIALIVVLDFIAWAAFVYGIGMIVPVWPSFLY
ncbi:MAG TPA: tricarboxylate transporter [Sutterella sp.]|nr:tricarboxylate transporter [Sutterella sp.]